MATLKYIIMILETIYLERKNYKLFKILGTSATR